MVGRAAPLNRLLLLVVLLDLLLLVLSMDIVEAVAVRLVVFLTKAGHSHSLSVVHRATCHHSIPVIISGRRSKHLVVVDVRV